MAGRPLARSIFQQLDEIGIEQVCEAYVATGAVTRTLKKLNVHPSRVVFYQWLETDTTGERRAAWDRARTMLADEAAEKVRDIPEQVTDPAEVPLARLRVDSAKWTAENFDRNRFGKQQQSVQVEVNVSSTWLVGIKGREGVEVGPGTSSDPSRVRVNSTHIAGQGLLPSGETQP